MKSKKMKYLLSFLFVLLCNIQAASYAQTNTGLEDKLKLDKTEYKLCTGSKDGEDLRVMNNSELSAFNPNSFRINWGDGSAEEVWLSADLTKTHRYVGYGTMNLVLSAESKAGELVQKTFTVMRLREPIVDFKKGESGISCLHTETELQISGFEAHSAATRYSVDYGDGDKQDFTQNNIKDCGGLIKHIYDKAPCPTVVSLTVLNECEELLPYKVSFETGVVVPAAPVFDIEERIICTGYPVTFLNNTVPGKSATCVDNTTYVWDFGEGANPRGSTDKKPPKVVYERPGTYTVVLETMNGLDCSKKAFSKQIKVVETVYTDFDVSAEVICSSNEVYFTNTSTGENPAYLWSVSRERDLHEFIAPTSQTTKDANIRFYDYGSYIVTLLMTNGCPEGSKAISIEVKKNPEILAFHLGDYDSLCPQTANGRRMDMQDYIQFAWNGNPVKLHWTITPADGVVYESGYNANSEYPRFTLKSGKVYDITVQLDEINVGGVVCGDPVKLVAKKKLKIHDPAIVADIVPNPGVADGKISICEGQSITFTNNSSGEYLKHNWTVTPVRDYAPGRTWDIQTSPSVASPTIIFNGYGDYMVTNTMSVQCGGAPVSFQVHVSKDPTIDYLFLPSAICPDEILDMREYAGYSWYNNAKVAHWAFEPTTVEYLNGTSAASPYPVVRLKESGKTYKIKVSLDGVACPDPGTKLTAEGEVRVRLSALSSDVRATKNSICEKEMVVFNNTADDPENYLKYIWKVSPVEGTVPLGSDNEEVYRLRFDNWGTYYIVGEVQSYCDTLTSAPIEIIVHKDPEVVLETASICPGVLDLSQFVKYEWWNNTPVVAWDIRRVDGNPAVYTPVEGNLTSLHPKLDFQEPGKYEITVALTPAMDCKGVKLVASGVFTIYDPAIAGEITLNSPAAGNPLLADICEGTVVGFTNTMSEEAGGLTWAWSVAGDADGYEFAGGAKTSAAAAPAVTFSKYGEYDVKVITNSTCNPAETKVFHITVRGVPDISGSLKLQKVCASTTLNTADFLQYNNEKNNILTYEWEITPAGGFRYVDETGAEDPDGRTARFPRIRFDGNNHYTITPTITGQCGGSWTQSTEVDVIRKDLKAAFATDSVGCTDLEIELKNLSDGDSLDYTWSVISYQTASGEGWSYMGTDGRHSESPRLLIQEHGFYDITLAVHNICGDDNSTFRVKAYSVPTVTSFDIAGECEPYAFKAKDVIQVVPNNDPVNNVKWTITANPADALYEYKPGADDTKEYPDIDFRSGKYRINVKYWNRCAVPGETDFEISVDKFIPINTLLDDTVCVLTDPFLLSAVPAGGEWMLKTNVAQPGEILYQDGGKYYFNPQFDPYVERDVELVYSKANLSCMAKDTMTVHIYPLPVVNAGDDPEMCIENGQKILTMAVPAGIGGRWTQDGNILADDKFTAATAGDFKLKYFYTDNHQCTNVDSVIMTVHPQPATAFETDLLPCIGTEVEFRPAQQEGNTFLWDFGDGSEKVTAQGNISHVFEDFGFRDVQNVTTSVHGCKDTSDVVRIEVVNNPPAAFFAIDTLAGCARFDVEPGSGRASFKVELSVDPDVYADNHNYLSFRWDYGDGSTSDDLVPVSPKYYPSGAWDTTYTTRFTVSNKCGTSWHDTVVTVYSAPKVEFALMRDWECSPVWLQLQNTTTGNNCIFDWTFTNNRNDVVIERNNVRNPEYNFETDTKSTTYYITLKATNSCDDDVVTQELVVKPRTIRAHFTPLDHPYACVNQPITFRNNSTDTLSSILNNYWNFGDGSRDTALNTVHSYSAAGTYVVYLKIDNGCGWDTISSPVNIYPLPELKIKSQDYLCEADTFTFVLKSDQELSDIRWNFGDGNNRLGYDSLRYRYEGYGKYNVTVIGVSAEINNCSDSVSKEIMVHNKPIVSILPLDTMVCSPLLYKPSVTGKENFFMWNWGDGSEQNSAEEHLYENLTDTTQRFKVMAYVETDKGCRSEYERSVTVYNLPRARLEKQVEAGKPQRVTFMNRSEMATDCIWYLPFGNVVHALEDQVVSFDKTGVYPLSLVAVSYEGCRDSVAMEHEVIIKGLYFPNTFIPHSGNDKISRFNGIAIGLKEYCLEIYDQYDNKLWETRALEGGVPSEGWDGKNLDGKLMPQGVYIWRAKAVFMDDELWTGKNNQSGVQQTVQGTVLLLRK